ncbi:putative late blight resistance protein homolog R1B-13 [Quercus lobata]|uniref:putative late blight resistance protein homolog R1B-13 n=1 Tax=Quercus lobata TaxID=97700 RepID=UPI001243F31F|nr:putative late blight resistance protein homolog R1B-13 [Quercus lobata]
MFRAELKEELLHGLEAKYSLNEEKLKGTQILDLKLIKEMNDEEFIKAWSEFLQSLKVEDDFYEKNGVKLQDMTDDELKSVLLESLEDKRYLLIMDDIWKTDVWNEVSTVFPNNSNGSRILITSRMKEVSLHASSVNNSVRPIPPYELPLLEEDKSWELFSKKVFWGGACPPELETLGRQLVKSCHGLPLAIVVLGGLLASEGFIWQSGNRNIEDVAEDYLEDLIDRSLIQVATKRQISQNFHPLWQQSIHSSGPCKPSNSRSIIGFGGGVELKSPPDNCYLEWICKSNNLVRVVELSNMGICCLIPKGIEKLVLLRYLSIASGKLHVIPDSICNLWNLETLDMRNSTVETKCLPKWIWKLQRLRHLYLDGPTSLPRTKKNTTALPNLQVLTGIAINEEDTESHFAKARFPNLRKLGLYSSRLVESGILSSLLPLCHLQTLKIYNLNEISSSPTSILLTLTKITLVDSAFMGVLGSLPKLRILKVIGRAAADYEFISNVLICDERSFQRLEVFKMASLTLFEWKLGQGAMPNLQRLVIERTFCMLPDELWCLSALRDVEVLHPDPELARRLRQLQMREGCKLHVYPNN